ncbi:MAG: alpha-amylase, partial [Bacteroidales bacterium]|nr:alpha-amylase [Bacteroidales bacterium]
MTLNSGIHSISNHKLLIYQLIPRLFGNKVSLNQPYGSRAENGCGTFADIDITALQAIKALGCTHIWLTGIIDHATCTDHAGIGKPSSPPETVKGRAGSPYAIRDYFDISPDLAIQPENRMAEFLDLTGRAHEQGLRVIIDHVPNHVARTYQGISRPAATKDMGEDDDTLLSFSPGNDFYYLPGSSLELPGEAYVQARPQMPEATSHTYTENPARATGNDVFHAQPGTNDWYETVKCNYGRSPHGIGHYTPIPPLWLKMKEILRFWALKGIDGFRCDMAGMVPVEYWEWVIHELKEEWPQLLFIAEIYEPWHYESYLRAGFDYLYDKVGFYDTLRNVMTGQEPASALSRSWQEGGEFRHRMLRFVENHDEQRIASKHFCGSPEPGIPATAAAMFLHPGPILLYNGQESGETGDEVSGFSGADGRTSIFDYWGMTRHQQWMNKGRFDGEGLDVLQKEILSEYQRLGTLATSE